MAKITGRESDQFNLRFPDGMRDRLKEEAAMNGRSLNAEIIARLQSTLEKRQITADDLYPEDPRNALISLGEIARQLGVKITVSAERKDQSASDAED